MSQARGRLGLCPYEALTTALLSACGVAFRRLYHTPSLPAGGPTFGTGKRTELCQVVEPSTSPTHILFVGRVDWLRVRAPHLLMAPLPVSPSHVWQPVRISHGGAEGSPQPPRSGPLTLPSSQFPALVVLPTAPGSAPRGLDLTPPCLACPSRRSTVVTTWRCSLSPSDKGCSPSKALRRYFP